MADLIEKRSPQERLIIAKTLIESVLDDLPSAQPTQTNTPNALESLDCISRQAAIDMAVDMYKGGDIVQATYSDIGKALVKFLNLVPSAQSEIIRCKDCAKREYCRTSTIWAVAPDDDWYCADAERRTE